MTDRITIPCYPAIGINGWTFTLTPDLARRIVALAQADATPVAGCIHDPGSSLLASRICQRGQKGCVIDHDAQPVAASTREAIERGMADSNAGRVTEMDFSQYADEPCPHCGKPCDTWFDRSLDADGNMATRCRGCGNDVDKPPVADDDAAERGFEVLIDTLAGLRREVDEGGNTAAVFHGRGAARWFLSQVRDDLIPGVVLEADYDRMSDMRDQALAALAACRACDDQHVRDLEACHKVQTAITAQRDRLAGLVLRWATILGSISPPTEKAMREELVEITQTAPTNGEGDAK